MEATAKYSRVSTPEGCGPGEDWGGRVHWPATVLIWSLVSYIPVRAIGLLTRSTIEVAHFDKNVSD